MTPSKPPVGKTAKRSMSNAPALPAPGSLPDPPDPKTVVAEAVLTSPRGRQYRVLRTDQRDATDKPENSAPGTNRDA